jgi:hypothetical protein
MSVKYFEKNLGDIMKLHIAFIAGLMTISAGYNPKWFNLTLNIKDSRITPGILLTMCENSPLYFTLPDQSRDYVKDVMFNISQRRTGTDINYDVDYKIISYNNTYTIQAKGMKKDVVEPILQRTFPQVFKSAGEQKWYFLRDLEKNEADKTTFKNVIDLINNFLPQNAQLQLDEKDFSAIQFNEWRAWFSPNTWRNWWRWRNETAQ